MNDRETPPNPLGEPLDLPCGLTLKNRIIKSPMSDSLGDGAGNATAAQTRLYERWAEGGVALSLIGEAQVTPDFPEKPGNLVLGPKADQKALISLAKAGDAHASYAWPQLGHAGALAYAPLSNPLGPSPLNVEGLQCRGMTLAQIGALPDAYAEAAALAKVVGFGGVQIHAGHGFLLSQFLSPLFNHRTDGYGGTIKRRFRIVDEIITAVRGAVGPSFPVGIRINATDKIEGGLTVEDALETVRLLDATSVDLIDVSGGTYFPGAASSSDGTSSSGPYFAKFGRQAKAVTSIPIALSGGIATRGQAIAMLKSGAADAVSVARAMTLDPQTASKWLSDSGDDPVFPRFTHPPRGGITAWYSMRLTALAYDREDSFDWSLDRALSEYDGRDAERCSTWRKQFPSAGS